jgi:flagellar basal-body rod protein FlgG
LCLFFGIAVLLNVKKHSSGRTTFQGEDHYRIHEQGNLTATDNTFDLAVQGRGYFRVQLPTGEIAYTRDGTFQLNNTGQVVTHDGYTVLPAITVPNNAVDVTVNASGQALVKLQGQVALSNVGQLQIANFPNEAGLNSIGGNLYLESPASGGPVTGSPASTGFGSILQGFLETSNVNPVEEISNLISAQRAYEMNSKVIKSSDDMMGTLSQLR